MVKILKIDWLSQNAKEAEVCVSDGVFCLVCFSHPFNYFIGDIIHLPLHTLNAKNVFSLTGDEVFFVERLSSGFEYKISGRVVNENLNQVQIGKFIIELDVSFPNDIRLDSFVSFVCDRIDLY